MPRRRATRLVYVCARRACQRSSLRSRLKSGSSVPAMACHVAAPHGGKIKLVERLCCCWIRPGLNECLFTGKLSAFEVTSQIKAGVKLPERPSSPPDGTQIFKMSSKTFFFVVFLNRCSLCPDQNNKKNRDRCQFTTFSSLSPSPPIGGGGGGGRGPEVCLGGRWLSVAVNREAF